MNHLPLKQLLLAMICCASIPAAYADSVVATESLTDSLKSSTADGVTSYYIETTGKYSVTAKISGDTFNEAGIFLADITEDTTVEISLGDFSFSSTLSAADTHTLTATKIAAKWSDAESVCGGADGTVCKDVKHTSISVASGSNGVTLKVNGTSKATDGEILYGSRVFGDICDTVGTGTTTADATLTVDGTPLTTSVKVTCSVKTKTQTKGEDTFDLTATKITAKKI